jgi:excinuclease ABC subunit C
LCRLTLKIGNCWRIFSERRGKARRIKIPQRGVKRTFVDLVNQNAKLSFDQRFRVLNPSASAIWRRTGQRR